MNYLDWMMSLDESSEKGEAVFTMIQEGEVVLVECPQRWYMGRVHHRGAVTFVLADAAAIGQIGDLGQFLDGVLTADTDISPLPRGIEIHLAEVQTVQPLTPTILKNLRVRTHEPMPPRSR